VNIGRTAGNRGEAAAEGWGMLNEQDERRLVEQAEADLEREFPQVPAERVRKVVGRLWGEFRSARVRDFIPVLVSREARAQLRREMTAAPEPRPALPYETAGA